MAGSSGRMLQLDVLRGAAIILVLFNHLDPAVKAGSLQPVANWCVRFGWTGVNLFFVLSGFLVGGLLFHELKKRGSLDIKRFLIRRGFKIWPAYYVFLVTAVSVDILVHAADPFVTVISSLPSFAFLQGYLWPFSTRKYIWSLAVEEHFYLLLPFLLALFTKKNRQSNQQGSDVQSIPAMRIATALILVGCLILRLLSYWHEPQVFTEYQRSASHFRIDELFFGVFLSYLYYFQSDRLAHFAVKRRKLLLLGGILLLAPMWWLEYDHPFVHTIGYCFLYLGWGSLLLALVHIKPDQSILSKLLFSPFSKVVAFVGVYSYSIFLWHYILINEPFHTLQNSILPGLPDSLRWLLLTFAYLSMCVLSGVGMAKLIEMPSLSIRDKIFPSRASALPSAATAGSAANFTEPPMASPGNAEPIA